MGVASASVYGLARSILGSREPKNEEEKAEERSWLSAIVGDRDAAAVSADETAKDCMLKLRMYRHFHRDAYKGLGRSLAAVVRVRRHLTKQDLSKGSPLKLQSRYVNGARRALEDLMDTLKKREGDPAENGYDEAAEIAERLSEFLEMEVVNLAFEVERVKDM